MMTEKHTTQTRTSSADHSTNLGELDAAPIPSGEGGCTRRSFLKIIFETAPLAVLAASVPAALLWPTDARSRPVAEPYVLALDDEGYLIDPSYYDFPIELPTRFEYYDLSSLTEQQQITVVAEEILGSSREEAMDLLQSGWFDEECEIEELSDRDGMAYTEYAPGIEIFEYLGAEEAEDLGFRFVEGDHPGSSFMGTQFLGDVEVLNQALLQRGHNLVVMASQSASG